MPRKAGQKCVGAICLHARSSHNWKIHIGAKHRNLKKIILKSASKISQDSSSRMNAKIF